MVATATEKDVVVRDLKLHYLEWGDPAAPDMLLLHGFAVSGHMFDEFAARFEHRYHMIALDQRGHGDSDWSAEGDYSRDAFVADIDAVRSALGLERFVLVGHSMGGLNAVAYAAQHPARVRALVLVDVGPEAAKEGVDNIVQFTRMPDELDFDEFVTNAHNFNPRRSIENIRERMRHRLKQLDNGRWTWKFDSRFRQKESGLRIGSELSNDEMWQLFRSVAVPTLIVRGEQSDVLTDAVAQRAAREMQRARLAVVPNAGHSVPGDNPDDFTAAVQSFLDDIESGAFQTAAAQEPKPLADLVDAHEHARHRPGALPVLLASAGALVALAGGALLVRRATSRKLAPPPPSSSSKHHLKVRSLDIDFDHGVAAARERAATLATDLASMSRSRAAAARHAVAEVDLDRARVAAAETLSALSSSARTAPTVARHAVARVGPRRRRATKQQRKLPIGLIVTLATGLLQASRKNSRKKKQQATSSRFLSLPWRS